MLLKDYLDNYFLDILKIVPKDSISDLYWVFFKLILIDLGIIFCKVYKVLICMRFTFEQLILFSPYRWPLSFVYKITHSYMRFCNKIIPKICINGKVLSFGIFFGIEILMIIPELLADYADNLLDQYESKLIYLSKKQAFLSFR